MTYRVLVTGITGQDGSYLAESLLADGYEVYGLVRRRATENNDNIRHILDEVRLIEADLGDSGSLEDAIQAARPDQVYNLAAQTHVGTSYKQPVYTMDVTGTGVLRMLEAVRRHAPDARFYQASTSELYGACRAAPHAIPEESQCRFDPVSPYAIAKLAAYQAVRMYRQAYGLWAVNGVLFNHESPRRGANFVTRKITLTVARRLAGQNIRLRLGNVSAVRDWGYAPEYVETMRLMLNQDEPRDWVVGTGEAHTVNEFLDYTLQAAGFERDGWVDVQTPAHVRPMETNPLVADTAPTARGLGWKAQTRAKELAGIMLRADMKTLQEAAAHA